MDVLFDMDIAGVRYLLRGDPGVRLCDPKPVYLPFLNRSGRLGDSVTMDMTLRLDAKMPPISRRNRIFDGGPAWSMYRQNGKTLLSLDLPGSKNPVWRVEIDAGISRAVVYAGPDLVVDDHGELRVFNPVTYPMDQILLMYALSRRKGVLLHAAGLVADGRAYLFPGRSGAGKSTLAGQINGHKGFECLGDDRLVVRKTDDAFFVHGTPWPGDAGISVNKKVKLGGIFFLKHARRNHIQSLGAGSAAELLFGVASIPWFDRRIVSDLLDFCGELVARVPICALDFKPGGEVLDVLDEFIRA